MVLNWLGQEPIDLAKIKGSQTLSAYNISMLNYPFHGTCIGPRVRNLHPGYKMSHQIRTQAGSFQNFRSLCTGFYFTVITTFSCRKEQEHGIILQ